MDRCFDLLFILSLPLIDLLYRFAYLLRLAMSCAAPLYDYIDRSLLLPGIWLLVGDRRVPSYAAWHISQIITAVFLIFLFLVILAVISLMKALFHCLRTCMFLTMFRRSALFEILFLRPPRSYSSQNALPTEIFYSSCGSIWKPCVASVSYNRESFSLILDRS
jgi:hypothetical protein